VLVQAGGASSTPCQRLPSPSPSPSSVRRGHCSEAQARIGSAEHCIALSSLPSCSRHVCATTATATATITTLPFAHPDQRRARAGSCKRSRDRDSSQPPMPAKRASQPTGLLRRTRTGSQPTSSSAVVCRAPNAARDLPTNQYGPIRTLPLLVRASRGTRRKASRGAGPGPRPR